jgi:ribosomal protein L37E
LRDTPPEVAFYPSNESQIAYIGMILTECRPLLTSRRGIRAWVLGALSAALLASFVTFVLGRIALSGFVKRDAIVTHLLLWAAFFVPLLMWCARSDPKRRAVQKHLLTLYRQRARRSPDLGCIRLHHAGIEFRSHTWAGFFYWQHFERIVWHNRSIIFALDGAQTGGFRVIGIPIDAFPNAQAAKEYFDCAVADHEASGHGERERIQRATDKAMECPHCGYSLLQLREPRCSECGYTISITMVRMYNAITRGKLIPSSGLGGTVSVD